MTWLLLSCCVQWGIAQFSEAKDDAHPDAIACRLRLTLVCIEAQCGDVAPSDDKEYAAYVRSGVDQNHWACWHCILRAFVCQSTAAA